MRNPVIFVELGFLRDFFNALLVPIGSVENPEQILFIRNLLESSTVRIDLPNETLIEILDKTCETSEDLPEVIIVYIRKLFLKGISVRSCSKDLIAIKQGVPLNSTQKIPDFILLDGTKTQAHELQKKCGIICLPLSTQNSYLESIYKVLIIDIKKQPKIPLPDLVSHVPHSFLLLIEDPYFYSDFEDNKKPFLQSFLTNHLASEFSNIPFHVIIVTADPHLAINNMDPNFSKNREMFDQFKKAFKKYKESLPDNITLDLHTINQGLMHDRHIISNSFWITCPYGFSNRYRTKTEWIFKPIGIYFTQMEDRVRHIINGADESIRTILKERQMID